MTQQKSTCLALLPIIPLHPVVARTTLHLERLNHSCCRRRPYTTDSGMEKEPDTRPGAPASVKASMLLLCDSADTEIGVINRQRTENRDGCFLLHTSYPGACFSALASFSLGLLFTRPAGEITSHLLVRTTFCHICQGDKRAENRRFPHFFSLNAPIYCLLLTTDSVSGNSAGLTSSATRAAAPSLPEHPAIYGWSLFMKHS